MKALRRSFLLLLTAMLVCVMALPVFADDDDWDGPGYGPVPAGAETIEPGDVKDVTPSANEEISTFVFTPNKAGDYFFEGLGENNTEGIVFTETRDIDWNYDDGAGDNFIVYFHAEAGVTYYLQSRLETEDESPYQVRLGQGAKPIGFANIPDNPLVLPGIHYDDEDSNFVEGEFSAAGEVVTFKFVPSEEGFYQFAYDNDDSENYYDLCVFTEDTLINMVEGDSMDVNFYGDPGVTYYLQMRSQTAGGRYTAYVQQDDEIQSESGTISFCGQEIVSYDEGKDEYLVSDNLPDGVAFDLPSRTLTLTNYSADFSGTEKCRAYIEAYGDLNIVLNGTNTFTGLDAVGEIYSTGIRVGGRLSIKGSGSLDMSMKRSTGIEAQNSIEIDGPSLTITGLYDATPTMFYGMTITPWENQYIYPNASSQFFIRINNAKLHISNKAAGTALNMGIDSQDADLSISNSEVSLDLNGGKTWGMGSGLYKSGTGRAYGGNLSIDNKSRVKIRLTGTNEKFIEDEPANDLLYALYFYKNNINSKYIYAAKHGESAKGIKKTDFWANQTMAGRLEGHYSFMDFSPTEQSYGNSGHTMEYHSNVTPTCTTGGNSEYWYCTDCHKYFSDAEGENEIEKDSWVQACTGHNAKYYEREAPTETYQGWKAHWYCNRCNKYFADADCTKAFYNSYSLSIPPTTHVHEMEHEDAKPATANYSGNLEYYYCTGCWKYFSDEAGEHEYEFGEWKLPPTGGDEPHEHSMSKTEAVAATCTAAGNTEYYYCSGCKKYFSDEAGKNEIEKDSWVVKALGHDLKHHDGKAATCTEAGWEAYDTCSRCDYTTYKEIAALGHDLKHHDAKAPTCTEAGWEAYDTCSRCDYTSYKELPALGHSLVKTEAVEATAEQEGNSEYWTCTVCGKYYSDVEGKNEIAKDSWIIPATGHVWDEGEITTEPTCTKPGVKTYTCKDCGKTRTEELQPLGHDLKHHDAKAATCTEAGWEAYDTCSRCDYTSYKELPAQGHSLVKTEAVDPTATEPGNSEYFHCSNCDKYFADAAGENEIEKDSWILPPTGDEPHEHSMSKTEAVAATCTAAGNTEYYYCSGCGKYFSDAKGEHEIEKNSWVIKALGHDMEQYAAVDPTATEPGNSEYFHCLNCDKYFADADGEIEIEKDSWILPPTGDEPHEHMMVFYEAYEPTTCYVEGNTAYWYCVDCGKYFSDEAGEHEIAKDSWIIPPLPHTLVHVAAEPATAYIDGNREYWYCSECYSYFDDEYGKNEIGYGDWVIPATGDDSGYEEDKKAADEVTEQINSMDPDDADSVAAARDAYDALTDDQKALVDSEVLQKLIDAENAIITDKIDLSTLDFKELSSYSWDGDEHRPCSSRAYLNADKTTYLIRNKDYTTQYLDNIDVGTATVILTGIGKYTGTKELYFDITPLNMGLYEDSVIFRSKSYTYDGKVKTPTIALSESAEDADYQFLAPFPTANDYKLTCSTNRRSVGAHEVTFTFHGNYTGELTYTFKINPKGIKISTVTAGKRSMTVKWKALKVKMPKYRITGYQIRYSRNSNMKSPITVTVKGYKAVSKKIAKLKSKKKYYVQIRTYMKVGKSTCYSSWSTKRAVRVK